MLKKVSLSDDQMTLFHHTTDNMQVSTVLEGNHSPNAQTIGDG